MSVSMAISSAALAESEQAEQEAHDAKVIACQGSMQNFHASTATVEQMQSYADCVDVVYPQTMDATQVIALKALFVIALIGAAIGFIWPVTYNPDFPERLMSSFLGFIFAPIGVGFIAAVGYGIYWLFA